MKFVKTPTQQQIIQDLHVKPTVEPQEEVRLRIDFLKGYVKFSGMKGFVLGISGGQDSSLAGRLCQLAAEELREETGEDYTFIALRLPYGVQHDEEDAQRALRFIRPDKSYIVNIKPAVDGAVQSFEESTGISMSDFNKGNQKAQERMTVHYRFANAFNVLVVGTDHAAEALPGFFTKYGDGGVDLTPLSGLSKQQGRELLRYLGADPAIYLKAPTADLLDHTPGRLDEDELGIAYEVMDAFLTGKSVPDEAAQRMIRRYQVTEHKRRLPVTPFDTWWQ